MSPHPSGLADLHGHVLEWCADWYDEEYNGHSPGENPQSKYEDEEDSHRILRGGSWYDDPQHCRASRRHWHTPGFRQDDLGFRVIFFLN